jgi:hypothetical protein
VTTAEVRDLAFHLGDILALVSGRPYDAVMVWADDDEWKDRAACKGKTDLFYPEDVAGTGRARATTYGQARKICEGCDVRVECLEAGRGERFGVWGGLSENERHPKQRRLGA